MELTRREIESVLVLSFAEPLNLEGESSERFKDDIRGIIREGNRKVVVDLSHVRFIDSSGLGALISSLKTLRANGGDLKLATLSEPVRSVLEITRLLRVFDTFDDAGEAVRSFEASVCAGESGSAGR